MFAATHEDPDARARFVDEQLRARGIADAQVLEAMRVVPRHVFVPVSEAEHAYADSALTIGFGQTISQPYMVARTCELARIRPTDRVLEIGTGSGYQAAVLGALAREVVSVERVPELARRAADALSRAAAFNVEVVFGDGTRGYAPRAPYDVIMVTAGAVAIPEPLLEQLAPGGRMVIPVGPGDLKRLVLVERDVSGALHESEHDSCTYVPFVGADRPPA